MASLSMPMPSTSTSTSTTTTTATAQSTPSVKPCCVCKEEKASRDECMLFSNAADPATSDCASTIDRYRSCMAGFGFKLP